MNEWKIVNENENEIKEHKTRENKKQNSFLFINLIYNLVVNHYWLFFLGGRRCKVHDLQRVLFTRTIKHHQIK